MSVAINEQNLFDKGPFPHVQRSLGLLGPLGRRTPLRACFAITVVWIPPLMLVAIQSLLTQDNSLTSFYRDFAVQTRLLLATPLLILAESACLPRLEIVARHFREAGLVRPGEYGRFDAVVDSTRRLMNSTVAEVLAGLVAYAAIFAFIRYYPLASLPKWYSSVYHAYEPLSVAGWWYVLISLPILLILFFGWLWRIFLWGRFLFLVAGLDLRLIASHPDRAGGLGFLEETLFSFMPLAFCFGSIVAGALANRVANHTALLRNEQGVLLGLLVLVLFLFAGPLMAFSIKLFWVKRRGIFYYGWLAEEVGRQFEKKWLEQPQPLDADVLERPDFSATTDLYAVVANVFQMGSVPFTLRGLVALLLVTFLPFLPVALMTVPLAVILEEVAKLFF